jgi:hypothetical protein
MTVETGPEAMEDAHIAMDEFPEAIVLVPMAVETSPEALLRTPIAADEFPEAVV